MPLLPATQLDAAIRAATLSPLADEPWYRSVDLVVAANLGIHVLDGAHTGRKGGRFNAPKSEPTCYLAGTQTLAAFECEQEAMILALPAPRNPRVTFAVSVSGGRVLNLTSALVLAAFGLVQTDLTQPSALWQHANRGGTLASTQTLAESARKRADCDGLLVPSWLCTLLPPGTLPRPINLVLFMDPANSKQLRSPGAAMTIHDPSGLL